MVKGSNPAWDCLLSHRLFYNPGLLTRHWLKTCRQGSNFKPARNLNEPYFLKIKTCFTKICFYKNGMNIFFSIYWRIYWKFSLDNEPFDPQNEATQKKTYLVTLVTLTTGFCKIGLWLNFEKFKALYFLYHWSTTVPAMRTKIDHFWCFSGSFWSKPC